MPCAVSVQVGAVLAAATHASQPQVVAREQTGTSLSLATRRSAFISARVASRPRWLLATTARTPTRRVLGERRHEDLLPPPECLPHERHSVLVRRSTRRRTTSANNVVRQLMCDACPPVEVERCVNVCASTAYVKDAVQVVVQVAATPFQMLKSNPGRARRGHVRPEKGDLHE
jgi:hypothetical protein